MATQDLEKLIVRLDADLRSYEKALAKAQGVTVTNMRKIEREVQASATRVEGSFAKMGNTFKNFGKGLLIGAGITGIGALGSFVQQTVSQAAKIGDLADKLGLSTDALQELQYGAVQADMSFQDMEKSLLRFSKTLGEAANGQGEYLKTLRANNQQLQGSFLGNLKQLADLVANAKNEQEALLIVTQAMGKGSDGMLEFLRGGSRALEDYAKAAQDAHDVIKERSVRTAQAIDDRWATLMNSLSQMTKSWVLDVVGAIDQVGVEFGRIKDFKPGTGQGADIVPDGFGGFTVAGSSGDVSNLPPSQRKGPVAGSGPEAGKPPVGTNRPVTKVANPEEEAEKKRRQAEADRLAAQAKRELTREREREADAIARQFEAFTGDLTRTDEEIAAMRLEAETLGLSTAEIERQRMAQELLNAANRAGIPITADLNTMIQQKSKAYGDAAQALEDMRVRQERIDDINSSVQDSITSFITDIAHGVEPVEALTDALSNLADQLIQIAMNQALTGLFDSKNGGGIGGAVAALVSHKGGVVGGGGQHRLVNPSVFSGARRMHRGGLAGDEVPTILQKGEIVLPKGFRGGSSGFGKVIVNNYGGQVEQKEQRGPGGERQLQIWFKSMFNESLSGPDAGRILGSAYGIRPTLKRR